MASILERIILPDEQCVEIFRDPSPGGYRSHTLCTDPVTRLSP